jgi:hypothetical protein
MTALVELIVAEVLAFLGGGFGIYFAYYYYYPSKMYFFFTGS